MLTKETVEDKLEYLHSKLPKQPTSIQGTYLLPKHFRKAVLDSNFSQSSLQKISDHIGYFLGLLNSVKVKIGIESSEHMLSTVSYGKNSDYVGLYKVIGGHIREIQLTKKFRFELCHILAILAHESTHHYLYDHRIEESNETENEILTDVAAAYLGLGALLLKGYMPIHWTSDEWDILIASGHTDHTMEIGYITPENVRYAIFCSAKLRNLEKLALPLPIFDRIKISFHFRKIRKNQEKSKKQIELLLDKLNRARSLYDQIYSKMQRASKITNQIKISAEDGRKMVEIANAISISETERAIENLSQVVNMLKNSTEIDNEKSADCAFQIDELSQTIAGWDRVMSKYVEQIRSDGGRLEQG
jgi:hypothetical protein